MNQTELHKFIGEQLEEYKILYSSNIEDLLKVLEPLKLLDNINHSLEAKIGHLKFNFLNNYLNTKKESLDISYLKDICQKLDFNPYEEYFNFFSKQELNKRVIEDESLHNFIFSPLQEILKDISISDKTLIQSNQKNWVENWNKILNTKYSDINQLQNALKFSLNFQSILNTDANDIKISVHNILDTNKSIYQNNLDKLIIINQQINQFKNKYPKLADLLEDINNQFLADILNKYGLDYPQLDQMLEVFNKNKAEVVVNYILNSEPEIKDINQLNQIISLLKKNVPLLSHQKNNALKLTKINYLNNVKNFIKSKNNLKKEFSEFKLYALAIKELIDVLKLDINETHFEEFIKEYISMTYQFQNKIDDIISVNHLLKKFNINQDFIEAINQEFAVKYIQKLGKNAPRIDELCNTLDISKRLLISSAFNQGKLLHPNLYIQEIIMYILITCVIITSGIAIFTGCLKFHIYNRAFIPIDFMMKTNYAFLLISIMLFFNIQSYSLRYKYFPKTYKMKLLGVLLIFGTIYFILLDSNRISCEENNFSEYLENITSNAYKKGSSKIVDLIKPIQSYAHVGNNSELIHESEFALKQNDLYTAKSSIIRLIKNNPQNEEPWLLLAEYYALNNQYNETRGALSNAYYYALSKDDFLEHLKKLLGQSNIHQNFKETIKKFLDSFNTKLNRNQKTSPSVVVPNKKTIESHQPVQKPLLKDVIQSTTTKPLLSSSLNINEPKVLLDMFNAFNNGDQTTHNEIINFLESREKPPIGNKKRSRELNDLALNLIQQRQYHDALDVLKEAHRLNLSDIEVINNLGEVYLDLGDITQGYRYVSQAILLKPTRYVAWFDLADVYAQMGQTEKSLSSLYHMAYFMNNKQEFIRIILSQLNNSERNPQFREVLQLFARKNNLI